VKPNFLGIGSVRGGSTWLHEVLKTHPQIFVPTQRKEVQYFTRYYHKGPEYYNTFFPDNRIKEGKYKWYGELTPGYLREPQAPERIAALGSVEKLIVTVRNPIDRAFSHYKWHLRVSAIDISFKQFYSSKVAVLRSLAIENGLYYHSLMRYLEFFDKNQILIIPYEKIAKNPDIVYSDLADFLEVKQGFELVKTQNESLAPKNKSLYRVAHKLTTKLRENNLDSIPNTFIKWGEKNS
jgi:hypothetical protein